MPEDKEYPLTPDQKAAIEILRSGVRSPVLTPDRETAAKAGSPHTAKLNTTGETDKGQKR